MIIRFKVPYDNGTIRCMAGDQTGVLSPSLSAKLVRSGIAEEVTGNEGLNLARAEVGLKPIRRALRQRKKNKQ